MRMFRSCTLFTRFMVLPCRSSAGQSAEMVRSLSLTQPGGDSRFRSGCCHGIAPREVVLNLKRAEGHAHLTRLIGSRSEQKCQVLEAGNTTRCATVRLRRARSDYSESAASRARNSPVRKCFRSLGAGSPKAGCSPVNGLNANGDVEIKLGYRSTVFVF